jgi:hypothetical protein
VGSPNTTQALIDAINTAEDITATLLTTGTENLLAGDEPNFIGFTACASRLLSALEGARDSTSGCPAAGVQPASSPQPGTNTIYVQWVVVTTISNDTFTCPGDQSPMVTEVISRLATDLSNYPGISGVNVTALEVAQSANRVRANEGFFGH